MSTNNNDNRNGNDNRPQGQSGRTNTGAPSAASQAKKGPDATDPLQAPQMDGSPERFLSEVPAHIAAQGADAPETPNAVGPVGSMAARAGAPPEAGKARYQLHEAGGWFDGHAHHGPGAKLDLTPEMAARLGRMVSPYREEGDAPALVADATGTVKR